MKLFLRLCLLTGELDWMAAMKRLPKPVMDVWVAFDALEPIGERRNDHRTIRSTSILAQALHSMFATNETPDFDPDDVLKSIAPPADHDWWDLVNAQSSKGDDFSEETREQAIARERREQATFRV